MIEAEAPIGPGHHGEEANPLFAVLPNPAGIFAQRATRLRQLAPGHVLEPYLLFIATISETQNRVASALTGISAPSRDCVRQALANGLPPLSRAAFDRLEETDKTLITFLKHLIDDGIPAEAAAEAIALTEISPQTRQHLIREALQDTQPENTAQRVLVLAALQIHLSKLAAYLCAADLQPIADAACPVCGSPPMTSSVVGWPKAHSSRFCACSLCGTMWNAVRVKCLLCGSTEGISYLSVEGKPDTIKAETCEICRGYVKVLYQVRDHLLESMADDVASLDLDMLVAEQGWRRGGQNPFLLGY